MINSKKNIVFIHEPLNTPVQAIGGQYMFIKEGRMIYKSNEILYLIGCALFDNTCCGTGGVGYAIIPGYIVKWKNGINEQGKHISIISPVTSLDEQKEIHKIIMQKEKVFQVQF